MCAIMPIIYSLKLVRKSMTGETEPELVVLQADRELSFNVVPFA